MSDTEVGVKWALSWLVNHGFLVEDKLLTKRHGLPIYLEHNLASASHILCLDTTWIEHENIPENSGWIILGPSQSLISIGY